MRFGRQGSFWMSKNPFSKENLEALPKNAYAANFFFKKKSLIKIRYF
jgi:hypothetical protein